MAEARADIRMTSECKRSEQRKKKKNFNGDEKGRRE